MIYSDGRNLQLILTSDNPSYIGSTYPISIISMESTNMYSTGIPTTAVKIGKYLVNIHTSPINQPIPNNVGDYQEDLLDKTSVFPVMNAIHCNVIGCEVNCRATEPSLDRLVKPILNSLERSSLDINRVNRSDPAAGTLMHSHPFSLV